MDHRVVMTSVAETKIIRQLSPSCIYYNIHDSFNRFSCFDFLAKFVLHVYKERSQRIFSIFLPRDAIHSADYAVTRWLSVRLSVIRRYSVKTVIHLPILFKPSGSHTILVFLYQMIWQHSDGDPTNWGIQCKGV